jgi:hypothetical protein
LGLRWVTYCLYYFLICCRYVTAAKTGLTYFILAVIALAVTTWPIRYCLFGGRKTSNEKKNQ